MAMGDAMLYQQPLVDAFKTGAVFAHPTHGILRPQCVTVGKLRSAQGRLGACDPMTTDLSAVFAREITPGEFLVEAAVAPRDDSPPLLLGVRVRMGSDAVERVTPAAYVGASAQGIAYASTGWGAFCDPDRIAPLDNATARAALTSAAENAPHPHLVMHPHAPDCLAAYRVGPDVSAAHAYVVSSYWGETARGQPLALWTDLGHLHTRVFESIPLRLPHPSGRIAHPLLAASGIRAVFSRWTSRRLVVTWALGPVASLRLRVPSAPEAVQERPAQRHWRGVRRTFDIAGAEPLEVFVEVLMGERPVFATFSAPPHAAPSSSNELS